PSLEQFAFVAVVSGRDWCISGGRYAARGFAAATPSGGRFFVPSTLNPPPSTRSGGVFVEIAAGGGEHLGCDRQDRRNIDLDVGLAGAQLVGGQVADPNLHQATVVRVILVVIADRHPRPGRAEIQPQRPQHHILVLHASSSPLLDLRVCQSIIEHAFYLVEAFGLWFSVFRSLNPQPLTLNPPLH